MTSQYKAGDELHDIAGRKYTFVRQAADGTLVVRDQASGATSSRTAEGKVPKDPGSDRELVLGNTRPIRNYSNNTSGGNSRETSKRLSTTSFEKDGVSFNITITVEIH